MLQKFLADSRNFGQNEKTNISLNVNHNLQMKCHECNSTWFLKEDNRASSMLMFIIKTAKKYKFSCHCILAYQLHREQPKRCISLFFAPSSFEYYIVETEKMLFLVMLLKACPSTTQAKIVSLFNICVKKRKVSLKLN